jgi:hypothetical protein
MRPGILTALVLSATLLPRWTAAQAADTRPGLGANAALKYWQAFALLPALDKDLEKLLEQWNKVPLDAAALKLIDRSRYSRVYLHRGSKLPHCDWSLNYEDGWRLLLPHLAKSRTLARLAALHARHEFEQGHWKEGAQDVAALMKLARHLEVDPMPLQHVMAYAIERMALEAAAPYLPELKQALPEAASDVLDTPPAAPTPQQLVLCEKQIMPLWLIQELKQAEQHKEGSWQAVWKEVFQWPEGKSPDPVPAAQTLEQALKLLEDILPWYDELAKVTALPGKEFDVQYPEFVKKAKAASPLWIIFPAMDKLVSAQRRQQALLAMFKAALAVVQGGPAKLKDMKDPFGDGPFEYRALDRGFELKSKLLYADKPVTLTVGQGKN